MVGRRLIEVPGYTFRVWVTSQNERTQALCRDDNQRASSIEELKPDLAADGLCLQPFFATAAAFLAVQWILNVSSF